MLLAAGGLGRGKTFDEVGAEGLVLAVIGWVGGLAAGWGLLRIVSAAQPALFRDDPSLAGFVDLVCDRTGGNPLFVLETLLYVWRRGALDWNVRRRRRRFAAASPIPQAFEEAA